MKKTVAVSAALLLALAVSLAALLSGNGGAAEAETGEPRFVMGYIRQLSESSWRDEISRSVLDAASQAGVQVIALDTDRTQDAQIQAMRTLITYRVDAIVLCPVVTSGWDNVLGEAQAAGIPLIFIDRRVKTNVEDVVSVYVGTDHTTTGAAAARYVMQYLRGAGEPVRIVELLGTVGSSSSTERSGGIRAAFRQSEYYDIYYSVNCDYMYSKSRETARIFLDNGRSPDVIISYSDAMTYGAIEAMEELGLVPGEDILIVSFDGEQQAVELLREGKINCLIETSPDVGGAVVEAMLALLTGGEAPEEILLPWNRYVYAGGAPDIADRGY